MAGGFWDTITSQDGDSGKSVPVSLSQCFPLCNSIGFALQRLDFWTFSDSQTGSSPFMSYVNVAVYNDEASTFFIPGIFTSCNSALQYSLHLTNVYVSKWLNT